MPAGREPGSTPARGGAGYACCDADGRTPAPAPRGADRRGGHEHAHGDHEPAHEGHGHGHEGHAHGHAHAASSARRLGLSVALASVILVAEAVGGWVSGSLALISDAGHMLTDVAALGLALLAVLFGARKADAKRTFGFRRLEVLAAQINVATLVVLTGWIVWEAVERLRSPPPPIALGVMAPVAAVGTVANVVMLLGLRGEHDLNTRSAYLHVLGDLVSSIAVLAAAGAMAIWPSAHWVDPALSLGIALLILWGVGRLVLEISDILMEAAPRHLDVGRILGIMEEADPALVAVHDLHVWTISSGQCALSAHLVVEAAEVGRNDEILTRVKAELHARFGIDHSTLQIESERYAHVDDVHHH